MSRDGINIRRHVAVRSAILAAAGLLVLNSGCLRCVPLYIKGFMTVSLDLENLIRQQKRSVARCVFAVVSILFGRLLFDWLLMLLRYIWGPIFKRS